MKHLRQAKLTIESETILAPKMKEKLPRDFKRKITPQRRLYSTKKKQKKSKTEFHAPTVQEKDDLQLDVMYLNNEILVLYKDVPATE